MMQATAEILGKKVQVEWSAAADKAMNALSAPLLVEMELYFSCLIRKAVRFGQSASMRYSVPVTSRLTVGFRPIITRACKVSDIADDEEPPVDDFQMTKPEAFVPKKLAIDFKRGKWVGEFHM
jgi:hypothetical protein